MKEKTFLSQKGRREFVEFYRKIEIPVNTKWIAWHFIHCTLLHVHVLHEIPIPRPKFRLLDSTVSRRNPLSELGALSSTLIFRVYKVCENSSPYLLL